MTEFHDQDLTGARFERVSLRGATLTRVYLNDARMRAVDLTGAQVRGALFNRTRMRGVELVDVEISGELRNVPSRVRGRCPKRRCTAASMTSGPSSRPCGTSTSPAPPGWTG